MIVISVLTVVKKREISYLYTKALKTNVTGLCKSYSSSTIQSHVDAHKATALPKIKRHHTHCVLCFKKFPWLHFCQNYIIQIRSIKSKSHAGITLRLMQLLFIHSKKCPGLSHVFYILGVILKI